MEHFARNVLAANAAVANTFVIGVERRGDVAARERLLDRALPDRRTKTCERLRAGRRPWLALVARDRLGRVIGTVRLWHVAVAGAIPGKVCSGFPSGIAAKQEDPAPALMLGPLAVDPPWQGRGVGAALLREALARAQAQGFGAVILVGDAPYYARFGFSPALTVGLDLPGPVDRARFQAIELSPGALEGACGLVVATGEREPRRHFPLPSWERVPSDRRSRGG